MAATEVVAAHTVEKKVKKTGPKKAKSSSSKAKTEPAHPTYLQMSSEAILALKERGGSSQYAIAKYIDSKYKGVLPPNFKKLLSVQLRNLVKQNKLVKVKASYKLSEHLKKQAGPKKGKSSTVTKAPKAPKTPKKAAVKKPKGATPKKAKVGRKKKATPKKAATKSATKTAPAVSVVVVPPVIVPSATTPKKGAASKKALKKTPKPKVSKSPAPKSATKSPKAKSARKSPKVKKSPAKKARKA